mmetsp:Transcript_135926/g.271166  ORF Transcript_135926/g.271166 Transcript_135926/m.271166 type:complete len:122 (-) Transcript_135926:502-867(-)
MDIGRLHGCRDGRCKGNTSTLNRSGFITPIVQPSLWPRHPKVGASSGPRLVWNYVQAACDVTLPLLQLLPLGWRCYLVQRATAVVLARQPLLGLTAKSLVLQGLILGLKAKAYVCRDCRWD